MVISHRILVELTVEAENILAVVNFNIRLMSKVHNHLSVFQILVKLAAFVIWKKKKQYATEYILNFTVIALVSVLIST